MTDHNGTPIFYELMTLDPDAAQDFYEGVTGWQFEKVPGAPGRDYRVFLAGDGATVGGMLKAPDGAPFPPLWTIYFSVTDVDAAADKVKSLGGSVHMEPQDIPGVGRFAFVADPQGAVFYVMRGDSDNSAFAPMKAGHGTWQELVTPDQGAAWAFYSALFGWEKAGTMPMGEAGDYTFFGKGEVEMIGGIMDAPEPGSGASWNVAFHLADLNAAQAAVEAGGGRITMAPKKLPTSDDWHLRLEDPQGASLILTGAREKTVA